MLVIAIMGGTLWKFAHAHEALNRAQSRGSDSVEVLSSARILTLLAQNNENLALVERGSGDVYVAEFDRSMKELGGTDGHGGLLGKPPWWPIARATATGSRDLAVPFDALMTLHSDVRDYDDRGDYNQAVGLSVGTTDEAAHARLCRARAGRTRSSTPSTTSIARSRRDITRAQVRLLDAAADARQGYGALELAIPVLAIIAGLLVLLGLERRIAEYR